MLNLRCKTLHFLGSRFNLCHDLQGKILYSLYIKIIYLCFNLTVDIAGSVLPDDDWFTEIAQDAMERLSGKPKVANGERDLNSPTASVSAQSMSSVRSHGSY